MKNSQKSIAAYFVNGGSLTVLLALDYFGTTELRRVVSRLKKQGLNIKSESVKGQTYHRYYIGK